ncbi:MAG: hypothetical protein ACR2P6_01550, partial [Gammaproteobacteria bacterium]
MSKTPLYMWLGIVMLQFSQPVLAGECIIDVETIDRGERRAVNICGPGLAADSSFAGLRSSGIEVEYQQFLKRCDVDNRDPGFYMWWSVGDDANAINLDISQGGKAGQTACSFSIDVPQRQPLSTVELKSVKNRGGRVFELRLDVPDVPEGEEVLDFSGVCDAGLSFPHDALWPELELMNPYQFENAPSKFRRADSA